MKETPPQETTDDVEIPPNLTGLANILINRLGKNASLPVPAILDLQEQLKGMAGRPADVDELYSIFNASLVKAEVQIANNLVDDSFRLLKQSKALGLVDNECQWIDLPAGLEPVVDDYLQRSRDDECRTTENILLHQIMASTPRFTRSD